jgi:hypothetical protein
MSNTESFFSLFKWAGHWLDDPDAMYQYQDGEYMTADEYDEFVYNPSGFMLGKWAPRMLDEARPENLKAMVDFTREHGIYRYSMTHIADTRE